MSKNFLKYSLVTLSVSAFAMPAVAEISAQELLDEWIAMSEGFGQQIEIGSQERDGDTLVISNLSAVSTLPEGQLTATIDWLRLREVGGAVEITLSPRSEILATAMPQPGMEVVVKGHTEQANTSVIVSGSLDELTLDISADASSFSIDDINVGPLQIEAGLFLGAENLTASYGLDKLEGSKRSVEGSYAIGGFELSFDAKPPGDDGFVNGSLTMEDLELTFDANFVGLSDIEAMIGSGKNPLADVNGGIDVNTGPIAFDFAFDIDGDNGAVDGTLGSAGGLISVTPEEFAYGFYERDAVINAVSSAIPFPRVTLKYDEIALDINAPLAQSDQPVAFTFLAALRGIAVNEEIWGIFDPTGKLPHDPVTAAIDVSGTYNILADLMNIGEIISLGGPPAEPVSLNLNELLVSAAGAELTGQGAFTFNNDNLETFDGIPQPIGSVDLSLRGGFGLMDKLIEMRLVPADAALGIRAMLGAFAKPGDSADHFVSTIELTPEGAVMANGQRLR